MKKTIAIALSMIFVLAAFSALTITASAAEQVDLYALAEEGEVVFTPNFHGIIGEWEPDAFMGTPVITPNADGTQMTITTSTDKSKNFWGAEITTLPLNENTRYTIYYSVTRTNTDSVGVYCDAVYGAYGYTYRQKLMNQASSLAGHDYIKFADTDLNVAAVADGETVTHDYALEVNGTNYAVTLYIKNNAGEYVMVDDSGFDGIPYFNSELMGLYFYVYYSAHSSVISNCYIVKGLSFGTYEVPETTPTPVETTTPAPVETTTAEPVETTPAPVETTPAPVETTPAPVETTPAPAEKDKGGCGSMVALGVVAALIPAAVVVSKKKR